MALLAAAFTALPAAPTSLPATFTTLPAAPTALPAVLAALPAAFTTLPAVPTALPAVLTAIPAAIPAHDLGFTRALITLLPEDAYRIDLLVDLDALALGAPQDTDDAELLAALGALTRAQVDELVDALRQSLRRRVRLRIDGETALPEVSFPDAFSRRARADNTMLGLVARLQGTFPPGAEDISLQASRALPPLHITFVDARAGAIGADRLDGMLRLDPPDAAAAGGAAARDAGLDALVTGREVLGRGDRSAPYRLDRPPPEPARAEVVRAYLVLGFAHIVPRGIDHILFVLGLFLLNTAWRPLLVQVTAFTAAHTLTLGLSTYGVIELPAAVVEPLIALSIVYIACENIVSGELRWWRPAAVFAFGLLHGLGFAGVLAQLGLPAGDYLAALLSFNVGVEIGQLAVIAVAFALLGRYREAAWYRDRITVPLSLTIGLVGIYWTVQRVLFA